MKQPVPQTSYMVDGRARPPAQERDLNEAFALVFGGPVGERCLAYLRRITIESVAGPEVTDGHLRHLEGQRFIVGVMQRRILDGQEKRPHVSQPPAASL